jgi:hypothetical protein
MPLEVEPGHAVLLHNWLIHRSGINPSPVPRRAFTACYMDGRTQSTPTGNHFPLVAGSLPAEPYPFVRQMRDEAEQLRQMREESERYARSLEEACARPASPGPCGSRCGSCWVGADDFTRSPKRTAPTSTC